MGLQIFGPKLKNQIFPRHVVFISQKTISTFTFNLRQETHNPVNGLDLCLRPKIPLFRLLGSSLRIKTFFKIWAPSIFLLYHSLTSSKKSEKTHEQYLRFCFANGQTDKGTGRAKYIGHFHQGRCPVNTVKPLQLVTTVPLTVISILNRLAIKLKVKMRMLLCLLVGSKGCFLFLLDLLMVKACNISYQSRTSYSPQR